MSRVPQGFFLFIWQLEKCGGVQAVIDRCHTIGIDGIFLKGADGDSTWSQCSKATIDAFHNAGIHVIGWQYVYGGPGNGAPAWSSVQGEINAANWILDQGVDGYCFDDEVEMDGKPQVALAQLAGIRAKHPDASIGYNPYPYPSSDVNHPFFEYNSGCDYCLPQLYQRQDNLGTPAQALARMEADFAHWSPIWAKRPGGRAAIPLLIDWQYASWGERPTPLADITDAAKLSREHGYPLITGWDWDALTPAEWDAVKQAAVLFKGHSVPSPAPTPPVQPVDVTGLGGDFATYARTHDLQGPHTPEVAESGWSWAAWEQGPVLTAAGQGVNDAHAGWALYQIQQSREATAKQLSDAQAEVARLKSQLADALAESKKRDTPVVKPAPLPAPTPVPQPVPAAKPAGLAAWFASLLSAIKSRV
jgi:hypothetical protein